MHHTRNINTRTFQNDFITSFVMFLDFCSIFTWNKLFIIYWPTRAHAWGPIARIELNFICWSWTLDKNQYLVAQTDNRTETGIKFTRSLWKKTPVGIMVSSCATPDPTQTLHSLIWVTAHLVWISLWNFDFLTFLADLSGIWRTSALTNSSRLLMIQESPVRNKLLIPRCTILTSRLI